MLSVSCPTDVDKRPEISMGKEESNNMVPLADTIGRSFGAIVVADFANALSGASINSPTWLPIKGPSRGQKRTLFRAQATSGRSTRGRNTGDWLPWRSCS